jgi:hypothetical protein
MSKTNTKILTVSANEGGLLSLKRLKLGNNTMESAKMDTCGLHDQKFETITLTPP